MENLDTNFPDPFSSAIEVDLSIIAACQGCYALFKDGELFYIGSSVRVGARISGHLKDKDFDSVKIIPMPGVHRDWLRNYEGALIRLYKPSRNFYTKSCDRVKSIAAPRRPKGVDDTQLIEDIEAFKWKT